MDDNQLIEDPEPDPHESLDAWKKWKAKYTEPDEDGIRVVFRQHTRPTDQPQVNRPPRLTLDRAEKERTAVELRERRLSFAQIGQIMGLSSNQVTRYYYQALMRVVVPGVDKLRATEWTLLNDLLEAGLEVLNTSSGDKALRAIDTIVKLSERRSKLMGLDMPERLELSMESVDAELQRAEAEVRARAAALGAPGMAALGPILEGEVVEDDEDDEIADAVPLDDA